MKQESQRKGKAFPQGTAAKPQEKFTDRAEKAKPFRKEGGKPQPGLR
jgi:hypothetical protein